MATMTAKRASVEADVEGARHAGLLAVWINRHGVDWPEGIGRPQHEIAALDELAALL